MEQREREIKTAWLYIRYASQIHFYLNKTKIKFSSNKVSMIIIKNNFENLRSYLTANELCPVQSN